MTEPTPRTRRRFTLRPLLDWLAGRDLEPATTEPAAELDPGAKPVGRSWKMHLSCEISRCEPADPIGVTGVIGDEIGLHYRWAGAMPIAPNAPHPTSGLSWSHCVNLIRKGTLDDYRWAADRVRGLSPFETLEAWHRWAAEIEAVIDAGQWAELGHVGPAPVNAFDLIPRDLPKPHLARR